MAFDWQGFFDRYRIEYVASGRNVRRGNLSLPCPFCQDDPSQNMGVSLEGKGWFCWRCEERGRTPQRLIVALIACTYAEASRIVEAGDTVFVTSDETFAEEGMRYLQGSAPAPRVSSAELEMLEEFKPLSHQGWCARLVFPYLRKRGYDERAVLSLGDRYNLRFASCGPFAYRIIIPIVYQRNLVNWTGRTVADSDELRYKSLSSDPERAKRQQLPTARMNVKDCLFDYDNLARGGETLVVCEGPFDAMRVGYFGEDYNIRATCLFGKSSMPAQRVLLEELTRRFDECVLLFDTDAIGDALFGIPEYLGCRAMELPGGVKDPAELTRQQFGRLFRV